MQIKLYLGITIYSVVSPTSLVTYRILYGWEDFTLYCRVLTVLYCVLYLPK